MQRYASGPQQRRRVRRTVPPGQIPSPGSSHDREQY